MGNIYAGNYYEESVEELDADTVAIESSFLLPKESIFAITIEIMKTLENFTGNNSIDTELNHDVDENFSLSLFPKSSAAYATTAINESLLELKRSLNIIPPNNLLLLTVENVSHILFRIFANSGDDRQKNGKDRDEDSGRDKESDSPAMHILLSNQRFLSLYLIILNKYITQCIKECNSLYKSAILLRKTTVLMSKNKTKDEMSNNRDGFSSDEDDFIIDRNRQRSTKVCHKKALDKQHLSTSTLSKEDEDTIRLSCTTNISYTYHLLLLSVNIKDSNKKFLSLYLSLKNMIEKNVNSSGANNGSSDGQNTKKLIALSSKLELFESILIKIVAEIDKPYAKVGFLILEINTFSCMLLLSTIYLT